MKLLLDTHVLIWWLTDNLRLGARARAMIADSGVNVMASVASPWEMSVKCRIGKMSERGSDMMAWLERQEVAVIGLTSTHLKLIETLPLLHRDPFDHLILAQAIDENARIMTEDSIMPRYGVPCIGVS